MAGTKAYSLDELRNHSSETDCWLAIHGKVYDVTEFLDEHPGESMSLPRCSLLLQLPPSLPTHPLPLLNVPSGGYDIVVAATGNAFHLPNRL
jgi:hypothetical protein